MTNFIETETSTVELAVEGMTCGSCQRRVRDALATVPGVTDVTVMRGQKAATIRWATSVPDVAALIAAVRHSGYDATLSFVSAAALAPPVPTPAEARCCCGGRS
jgi:Cu+-exporting ATPase